MRGPSARRELAFVVGFAAFGVALVLVVAFAPWYPALSDPAGAAPAVLHQMLGLLGGV
ncbi:hypothetical protein Ade02nite_50840 [Paractinoplanes deccanensis]|uniref:Uncharacterized protein n=1 Tax=Paractinoplanes deccanensis TaxID=113561 RepID=A0ABQ3Y900_9ACTN|nr:hypothetical protein [Actinoplanes deccanensis]GID76443.1 hypothetical protein Ade02nite_50840 [Actinoplanes deccanensis]